MKVGEILLVRDEQWTIDEILPDGLVRLSKPEICESIRSNTEHMTNAESQTEKPLDPVVAASVNYDLLDEELLGRVAFEAYNESKGGRTYDDKQIPPWDHLSETVQTAWKCAARAVRARTEMHHFGSAGY